MPETRVPPMPFPIPTPNPDHFGLESAWPPAIGPADLGAPGRVEGEMADLIVLGEIPKEVDGTFYRMMVDPFYPLMPGNPPVEGDGNISAFRIHDGKVDLKIRYVDTERLRLERAANKRLFGLYRNPFTHHPCVRAAVDSTANTNLVYWGGHVLALKEGGLPYAVDPNTLATRTYDPFQSPGKTFSAHPKIDPFSDELVVFGYEAKELGSDDVVTYHLTKDGKIKDIQWNRTPWPAMIHDCAITTNCIILFMWPFKSDVEHMKQRGQHWKWADDKNVTFQVIPRRADTVPAGWESGETRSYQWSRNAFLLHSAAAWEDDSGKLYIETSRVLDTNLFPAWGSENSPPFRMDPQCDFVRWELDTSKPTNSTIPDPVVVLPLPSEFPRIDERYMGRKYNTIFLPVAVPDLPENGMPMSISLTGLAKVDKRTGTTEFFRPGTKCIVEEPVFIPRSKDSPEGDGWVLCMVQRLEQRKSDLVVLDSREFTKPKAIIRMPLYLRGQIHGNWVESQDIEGGLQPLARVPEPTKVSNRGALEPQEY
ncbi:hypothetical protein PFICI_03722 [Pestalotiopsis fici W106-1]|uniref:Uncharacterized protein n=1 Tax=Pestalotiopsis fici (strain W106-1 / CGMCC3.15140) TaxID=1229662 RepID=W3XJN9_PESFW|nr:uncharacterized protein PFICI_03722 [Pestalotiopsis fici W106-1]ETS85697.1 hypothetical protein PFICI_03722 [Pestalotiopsis fici W106-1]